MKTVMKKMFCLLLVAVMLVGVMPFAAFAESEGGETTKHCDTCEANGYEADGHEETDDHCSSCSGQYGHTADAKHCPVCHWYGGHDHGTCTYGCDETGTCAWEHAHKATCLKGKVCEYCLAVSDHFSANCPTTCSKCSNTKGHDETDWHCPICNWYGGHDHGTCTYGCTELSTCDWEHVHKNTCVSQTKCETCKAEGQHFTANCPYKEKTCTKCQRTYKDIDGTHVCCDRCKELHATADCPYCEVCWNKGDTVKTHKTDDHCGDCGSLDHDADDHCTTCGKTDGTHKQGFSCYESKGNSTVKVHVRLYTSNVHTKTVELLTYKDSSDARIYSSVAKHDDLIRAELAEQYPGYSWSGNLYDNPGETEDTKETIGKGTTVYINAYTDQDLIYIYVHNSRSMSNLRIVQLEGKQVGETVTKSEVTKAVSKYFSVNSLSMYSEQAWEDYVDGDSVESVSSLKVTSDPYFIDVKISGSAKSTSGSGSTADSTNPKTGDAIFAPAMILGLSASALVVLYYLNKKRAF